MSNMSINFQVVIKFKMIEYKTPVSVINVRIKHSKLYNSKSGLVLSCTKMHFLSKYLRIYFITLYRFL